MDNIEDILRALAEDAPEDSGSKDEVSQDGGLFPGLTSGAWQNRWTSQRCREHLRR